MFPFIGFKTWNILGGYFSKYKKKKKINFVLCVQLSSVFGSLHCTSRSSLFHVFTFRLCFRILRYLNPPTADDIYIAGSYNLNPPTADDIYIAGSYKYVIYVKI